MLGKREDGLSTPKLFKFAMQSARLPVHLCQMLVEFQVGIYKVKLLTLQRGTLQPCTYPPQLDQIY